MTTSKYDSLFFALLLSVLVVFFYVRPPKSAWHPFIAGDGLGYYAYLPAKFIHNDPQLDFKWFNRVYNANYVYSSFPNPEDNLLVQYGGKKINKYYQGLAYIWMPFFIMGHIYAKLFHYTPDGFSLPYQLAMGLASLFYLLIGLFFLRKLLLRLFHHGFAAAVVPFLIFYGTHLYTYAIFANTLSHAYSFTFCVLFLYAVVLFFQEDANRLRNLLLVFLFLCISVCIRPLNGVVVFTIPAFIPQGFFKKQIHFGKFKFVHALILVMAFGSLCYQLWLTHIQTGSFFAYTYTDEHFDFLNPKFLAALFSYHMGLFVYVPLMFIALVGSRFLQRKMALVLGTFFLFMLFVYSSWWYWPIVKRAMIDFYAVPAIFLGALISHKKGRQQSILLTAVLLLSLVYFQFKNYQVRSGILDEYTTYREVFWKKFFSTTKTKQFLVPPKSILKSSQFSEGFESPDFLGKRTDYVKRTGKAVLLLDSANFICTVAEHSFPAIFKEKGGKKIRFSFAAKAEKGMNMMHVFFQFVDHHKKVILELPFYTGAEYFTYNGWEEKEFGYDISDSFTLNANTVASIRFIIWNVEAKKKLYIDDVKVEFLLTDLSYETLK
ncbi:MAG: hypothetical protein PSX36_05200 [bacterium]|nr:hypothetical protein [bacterium]